MGRQARKLNIFTPFPFITFVAPNKKEKKDRIAHVDLSSTQFTQIFSGPNVPPIDMTDDGTIAQSHV